MILTFETEFRLNCRSEKPSTFKNPFPFRFNEKICIKSYNPHVDVSLSFDYTPYPQLCVAYGFISILYCILILFVYILFDGAYKTKPAMPKTVSFKCGQSCMATRFNFG